MTSSIIRNKEGIKHTFIHQAMYQQRSYSHLQVNHYMIKRNMKQPNPFTFLPAHTSYKMNPLSALALVYTSLYQTFIIEMRIPSFIPTYWYK